MVKIAFSFHESGLKQEKLAGKGLELLCLLALKTGDRVIPYNHTTRYPQHCLSIKVRPMWMFISLSFFQVEMASKCSNSTARRHQPSCPSQCFLITCPIPSPSPLGCDTLPGSMLTRTARNTCFVSLTITVSTHGGGNLGGVADECPAET